MVGWSEDFVEGHGKTLKYKLKHDRATFTQTGPAARVKLDDPDGVGIANLSGARRWSAESREIGPTYLLNLPGIPLLAARIDAQEGLLQTVQFRSYAVQFGKALLNRAPFRFICWALFAGWAANEEWVSMNHLASVAGVDPHTVERLLPRALALGLPLMEGLTFEDAFAWSAARCVCLLPLLEAGCFAEWPTRIEKVDEFSRTIRAGAPREEFMFVAQAVLSLRMRRMGESPVPVRALIAEGGHQIGLRNERLAEVIKRVREALELLGFGSAGA